MYNLTVKIDHPSTNPQPHQCSTYPTGLVTNL